MADSVNPEDLQVIQDLQDLIDALSEVEEQVFTVKEANDDADIPMNADLQLLDQLLNDLSDAAQDLLDMVDERQSEIADPSDDNEDYAELSDSQSLDLALGELLDELQALSEKGINQSTRLSADEYDTLRESAENFGVEVSDLDELRAAEQRRRAELRAAKQRIGAELDDFFAEIEAENEAEFVVDGVSYEVGSPDGNLVIINHLLVEPEENIEQILDLIDTIPEDHFAQLPDAPIDYDDLTSLKLFLSDPEKVDDYLSQIDDIQANIKTYIDVTAFAQARLDGVEQPVEARVARDNAQEQDLDLDNAETVLIDVDNIFDQPTQDISTDPQATRPEEHGDEAQLKKAQEEQIKQQQAKEAQVKSQPAAKQEPVKEKSSLLNKAKTWAKEHVHLPNKDGLNKVKRAVRAAPQKVQQEASKVRKKAKKGLSQIPKAFQQAATTMQHRVKRDKQHR